MNNQNNFVAAIDIGTTKVCAAIGRINEDQTAQILGAGSSVSSGVVKGIIVDSAAVAKAIRRAVIRAENICGFSISSAFCNLSGAYIKAVVGESNFSFPGNKVNKFTFEEINKGLKNIPVHLKEGEEIVYILPKSFRINGGDWISNPVGKTGNHFAIKAFVIKGDRLPLTNITDAFEQSKIKLNGFVLNSLALSEVLLTPQDREDKTLIIDFGGGTTDIISFNEGTVENTFSLGLGGNHLTHDISYGMDINFTEAERLKILYGGCFSNTSKEEEAIEVFDKKQDLEAKKVSRRFLSEIIEARCREIFNLINSNLLNQKYNKIILVGGSSQINNLRFLIEEMFDHPIIQIGVPDEKKGIIETPIYAVSIGTILYALKSNLINPGKNGFLTQIKKTAKIWFQDFFS